MPDARFSVEVVSGVPVVVTPEEIDITNADGLRAALLEAAAYGPGPARLVVDMSRTQFCDTAGIHALVAAHKRAEAGRGEVRLVITGAAVLRIFAITGLDSVIPHFASLEDALAATARSTESG
jgi:anti-sigma B factor antagonist